MFVTVNKQRRLGGEGDFGKPAEKQASHLNAEFREWLVFSSSVSV